ncbi:MAG: NFACT RNA binding domain-containing protein [Flavobacterium sp.]
MKIETVYIHGLNREITFYIGRNQNENDQVIDMGAPDDLWFHVNEVSSCHVVASIPEDIVTSKEHRYIIKAGAMLCKKYTHKTRSEPDVDIVYTKLKYVTKTRHIGCVYITKQRHIKV